MNDFLRERRVLVCALLAGALGISLLWAGGVDFPVAVPPGIVILVVGAAVVATIRRPWTAWLGGALGLFVLVGFLVAGINGDGFDHLLGRDGAVAAVGQVVEVLGVLVAVLAGPLVARSSRD